LAAAVLVLRIAKPVIRPVAGSAIYAIEDFTATKLDYVLSAPITARTATEIIATIVNQDSTGRKTEHALLAPYQTALDVQGMEPAKYAILERLKRTCANALPTVITATGTVTEVVTNVCQAIDWMIIINVKANSSNGTDKRPDVLSGEELNILDSVTRAQIDFQ